jgi:hypothetical protein
LCLTGNSSGQPPSGISGTGPFVGPPALKRSLGGSALGDAVALLGGDALVVGGGVSGGGLVVGGSVLGGGLVVGGGVVIVVEGGLEVGGGVMMVVAGGLLAPLPTAPATGTSSLAGSAYCVVSQAIPSSGPGSSSSTLGSLGSSLSAACASAWEL